MCELLDINAAPYFFLRMMVECALTDSRCPSEFGLDWRRRWACTTEYSKLIGRGGRRGTRTCKAWQTNATGVSQIVWVELAVFQSECGGFLECRSFFVSVFWFGCLWGMSRRVIFTRRGCLCLHCLANLKAAYPDRATRTMLTVQAWPQDIRQEYGNSVSPLPLRRIHAVLAHGTGYDLLYDNDMLPV